MKMLKFTSMKEDTRNIAIPISLHVRLKSYADEKGLLLRALVAKAVAQYLDRLKGTPVK